MIIVYGRSSSLGTWKMCPWQYVLEYQLGIKSPSNFAADKGQVVHKSLEILAWTKLLQQRGGGSYTDEETGVTFEGLCPDEAFEIAYDHYSSTTPRHDWSPTIKKECHKWMWDALTFNGGLFNPLLREIVEPEQYFDFAIEEDWAKYHYELPNGEIIQGHFSIKGTIDLVCAVDGLPDVIELVDWKTGARKDWSDGSEKTYDKLMRDVQLRMYHYALTRLYPDKTILITIVFIKDGGPISLPFEMDTTETLEMLREYFEEIRDCNDPIRVKGTSREWIKGSWKRISKCQTFCHFGTTDHEQGKSLCDHYWDEFQSLGMEEMMEKHGDVKAALTYGSGGGQSNREEDNE